MKLVGEIKLPGDKSITHRALMINSISKGKAKISNYLNSEDTNATINILQTLGVSINKNKDEIWITGKGFSGLRKPSTMLDCKNSGTSARLFMGLLSGLDFETILVGDQSLSKRPMFRVCKHLLSLNSNISLSKENFLPAYIFPSKIKASEVFLDISSAQVKSAVMLTALKSNKVTVIHELKKSRNHTEILLKYLGCDIETKGLTIKISGKKELVARDIKIPGDLSSAAFFIVAALIIPKSKIIIKDCSLNPTRTGILTVLKQICAKYKILNIKSSEYEVYGDILIEYTNNLQPFIINNSLIPLLIDEIPILALLATQISGVSYIKDVNELRIKETDRLKAIKVTLSSLGCDIIDVEDGLVIKGKTKLKPNIVDSYNDHRISMMLKIAQLICEEIEIKNDKCDSVSYPGFEKDLNKLLK